MMTPDELMIEAATQMAELEMAQTCLTYLRQGNTIAVREILESQMDLRICALGRLRDGLDSRSKAASQRVLALAKQYRIHHPRTVEPLSSRTASDEAEVERIRRKAMQVLGRL